MGNLVRKKIVLSLLDSNPKPAKEIAAEIGESLASVEGQLTVLVSENICEKINQDESSQYVVKKDIETFAQLVKAFLSDKEEHREQIEQFITSEYYFNRIDFELVDYVLSRFYLDSVYQTDENKLAIGRILIASPSALLFALFGDTTMFRQTVSDSDQLDSSDETREWLTQILNSQFITPLLENLIADMKVLSYCILYAKLGVRVALVRTQVKLATVQGKYIEAVGGGDYSLFKAAEDFQAGQLVSAVNPMIFSDDGLALMHLGEFQEAHENFDKALNAVQNPVQKATVLNNAGLTFLMSKQYQKAIECFEDGIQYDLEGQIPALCKNKQVAEEYLARATDADNLTNPTRVRFVRDLPVPFEETRFYEFKEIGGGNAIRSISDTSDIYTVAFLNYKKGGRIFWGIRNKDRITIGVPLNEQQRDELRVKVSEKLGAIQPSIVGHWQFELHPVYDLPGETIEDLWVVELLVPPPQRKEVFYTGKGELHVKTEGGKKKLLGPAVTEFIYRHFQNDTETS